MRILLDTHAFLWEVMDDPRSSKKAREIMRSEAHDLVFSYVSLWEIAVKIQIGKLPGVGSSVEYVRDELNEYGIELLPVRYEHIVAVERLPLHHRDPFDRLLIAQAVSESLPILTNDRHFAKYPVKVIW